MHFRYKILVPVFIAAIAVLSMYAYVYAFAEIQISQYMKVLSAPDEYAGLTIQNPPHTLTLWYQDESIIISPETLRTWYETYQRVYTGTTAVRPNAENINRYLNELSTTLDIPPVDAKFGYRDEHLIEFIAPRQGTILNIEKSFSSISTALVSGSTTAILVIDTNNPQITLDNANSLGITTLLASGESNFAGSSAARIHNIKTAAKLFDGILVKPGEEFSFNKVLGNVDAITGYLPELVIKNGVGVKEYGGGICQVATTLFRTAINSGLPIIERKPHTLLVRYYDRPGFDATVYPGQVDLRFTNDTANNILIQPQIEGTKISFDIYGTPDNREIVVTKPYQYATGADGSVKTVFTRSTKLPSASEAKKESFYSSYKVPQQNPTLHNPLE